MKCLYCGKKMKEEEGCEVCFREWMKTQPSGNYSYFGICKDCCENDPHTYHYKLREREEWEEEVARRERKAIGNLTEYRENTLEELERIFKKMRNATGDERICLEGQIQEKFSEAIRKMYVAGVWDGKHNEVDEYI